MLLAPNDPNNPSPRVPPRLNVREEANFNYALIALCTGLLTFSIVTGIGLATRRVSVERAYVLMTPLPLALALWFAFGALRARPLLDLGLWLSCGGWAMVFLTLLAKHFSLQSELAAGTPLSQVSDGPLVWILAVVSVLLLGAGAWSSWQKARNSSE